MKTINSELTNDEYGTSTTECLNEICEEYGFDYASFLHVDRNQNLIAGFSTYPDEWKKTYLLDRLWEIDPVVKCGIQMVRPFEWTELETDVTAIAFLERGRIAGLGEHGLTVPTIGPFGEKGLLSVTSCSDLVKWKNMLNQSMSNLQRQAQLIHLKTLPKVASSPFLNHLSLNSDEITIIKYIACGKTEAEISSILKKRQRTVRIFLGSLLTKLCCETLPQAVAQSIKLGIINPNICFGLPVCEIVREANFKVIGTLVEFSRHDVELFKAPVTFQYNSRDLPEDATPMRVSEIALEVGIALEKFLKELDLKSDELVRLIPFDPVGGQARRLH